MMKTFRVAWVRCSWKLFLYLIPFLYILFIIFFVIRHLEGNYFVKPLPVAYKMIIMMAVLWNVSLIINFLSTRSNNIIIENDGLTGQRILYGKEKILWSQKINIRFRKLVGLSFIIIKTKQKKTLWLPMEIDGYEKLLLAVVETAPEGHPLRKLFELELAQRELLQQ